MTKLHKIRWFNDNTDERGTSIFLAKSENHAMSIWHHFHKEQEYTTIQAIKLVADEVYEINLVNQLKEGEEFLLALKCPDGDLGPFWNDEYTKGTRIYVKGPYDPTRHKYECTDPEGFTYYIKPYETIIKL